MFIKSESSELDFGMCFVFQRIIVTWLSITTPSSILTSSKSMASPSFKFASWPSVLVLAWLRFDLRTGVRTKSPAAFFFLTWIHYIRIWLKTLEFHRMKSAETYHKSKIRSIWSSWIIVLYKCFDHHWLLVGSRIHDSWLFHCWRFNIWSKRCGFGSLSCRLLYLRFLCFWDRVGILMCWWFLLWVCVGFGFLIFYWAWFIENIIVWRIKNYRKLEIFVII